MPVCRDPLVTQLNSLGFNALRVPRTDYSPGSLLVREGRQRPTLFGSLPDAFENVSQPEPSVSAAGQFSGATTASYRKKTGLKLASDWLKLTPSAALSAAFDGARRITFRFGDMRILAVTLAALTDALMDAEPSAALSTLPESRLFVINEVLQAKDFLFLAEDAASRAAAVAATALDPATVKLDVSIDSAKAASGLLVFKAGRYHTIGFKAYEIELAGGDFRLVPNNGTGLSHMASYEQDHTPAIFDDFLL